MGDAWFEVAGDVRVARTPPSEMYGDPAWHARTMRRVWDPAWQYLEAVDPAAPGVRAVSLTLCGEPLLYTRSEEGEEHLLSNVCTHRGARLVEGSSEARTLRCPYHGRRFRLDGTCAAAPGFEATPDVPGPDDDLASVHLAAHGPWRFGSIAAVPPVSAEDWLAPLTTRLPWLDWSLTQVRSGERHHSLGANWALYVENYLEGLHIPYVHPGLAKVLDGAAYRTELLPWGTLQVGVARSGAPAHHPPAGDPDHGTPIGAYYFWLFPGTMINVYPWGVSMNQVEPEGPRQTCIHYRTWARDPTAVPDPDIDTVEAEDQAIVLRVQAGVTARRYAGGRYSPTAERGVHHFHRLLAAC